MDVLAIAVHPDDETLGCGATLLRHSAQGDTLHWLIVTAAKAPDFTDEQMQRQADQVAEVRAAYGFASLHSLQFPASRLETLPLNDLISEIRSVVAQVRPELVYVPHRADAHSDHRVVFEASSSVLKSFYMAGHGVRRVLACEVPSETDAAPPLAERAFVPNIYVDVTATFPQKLEIMAKYRDQVQPGFLPRGLSAIEALGRHRGAAVGVQYAEAFMLIRETIPA